MNSDGSPKAPGLAIHDLTTLLADTGATAASFATGSLTYTLSGTQSGDNTLLFEKSNGTYWLTLWNEQQALGAAHSVTLTLGSAAAQIVEYDPLTGTSAVATVSNAATATITVPDHPVLVEIVPAAPTPPAYQDLSVTVPASESVTAGASIAVTGVSIADAWASTAGGTMALNVYDTAGTISVAGQTHGPGGGKVAGGMLTGTEAQLNADLATLTYKAGANAGTDTLTVDVWNQAGVEVTRTIQVDVAADVIIPPTQASDTISVSNETIGATSGNHTIFINGTDDTLSASGGTETVQANQGGNRLTTGTGNDTIRFATSNNVINAGAGSNTLYDSGSNNTIVLPPAGQGTDTIYGQVMTNGDKFDLRGLLAATKWTGSASTLGNFIKTAIDGKGDAVISVNASGVAGGASTTVATLMGSGAVSVSSLLAHSITS